MTIKPLVRILHVKLRGKEQKSMYAELNEKVWSSCHQQCLLKVEKLKASAIDFRKPSNNILIVSRMIKHRFDKVISIILAMNGFK